jgi:hypothetical protein
MADSLRPYVQYAEALGMTVERIDRSRRHPHLHLRTRDGRETRVPVANTLGDKTRGARNLFARLRRIAENRDYPRGGTP